MGNELQVILQFITPNERAANQFQTEFGSRILARAAQTGDSFFWEIRLSHHDISANESTKPSGRRVDALPTG
jgi:hypothetical protein